MERDQWLGWQEPVYLLNSLDDRVATDRKLRLFACATCRRLWTFIVEPQSRRAVEVSEALADGLVSLKELGLAHTAARVVAEGMEQAQRRGWNAAWTAAEASGEDPAAGAYRAAQKGGDADLVREIFNPYLPTQPAALPSEVTRLAEALYAGEKCAFALHDALLDANHAELAEHFEVMRHYKGCWALDLILGRS